MTDLKGFLTGSEPTDTEHEIYNEELKRVNRELLLALPALRQQFTAIKNGDSIELEVRSIRMAVPKLYWETFEHVIKMFELRDQLQIKDDEDEADQIQDNVAKTYRNTTDLHIDEILMSQLMLDTVLGFALHVARAQLLEKVQAAIETGDPEMLVKLIQNLQEEGLNEPDDDDSKN